MKKKKTFFEIKNIFYVCFYHTIFSFSFSFKLAINCNNEYLKVSLFLGSGFSGLFLFGQIWILFWLWILLWWWWWKYQRLNRFFSSVDTIDDGKSIFLFLSREIFQERKLLKKTADISKRKKFSSGKFLFLETKQKIIFSLIRLIEPNRTNQTFKIGFGQRWKTNKWTTFSIQIFFFFRWSILTWKIFCWIRKELTFSFGWKTNKTKQWLQSFKLRKIFEYLK